MRLRHRIGGLLGTLVLAGAAVIVAPAGVAAAAQCPGTSGVTVIVDTGSSITTRCASGDPGSGLAALSSAGFSVTQVQTQPGFVCRIGGFPAKDPCRVTPPTDAYWSYWHAPRGGSWSYSSRSAGSHDPAPGSVEGWRFGSRQAPGISPPAMPPAPKPTPTKTPTAKPKPTAKPEPPPTKKPTATAKATQPPAARHSTSTPPSTPPPAAKPPAAKGATPTPATSSTTGNGPAKTFAAVPTSTPPSAGSSASGTDLALAAQAEDSDTAGGGLSTLIAGGLLVALVAIGAGFVARKRRT